MQIKKILSTILTVCIVVTSFPLVVQATEQTEEETVSSVTQVVEEMEEIENKMQTAPKPAWLWHFNINSKDKFIEFMTTPKYHKSNYEVNLHCDIDMGGVALGPINEYKGKFNGNGHVISNISFSNCCFVNTNHGTISGIVFFNRQQANVVRNGNDTAGFVIMNYGNINNCIKESNIVDENSEYSYVAGFVSWNYGQITGCQSLGEVRGKDVVAGFVGKNEGTITGCTAGGRVIGNKRAGGFVGWNIDKGKITGCQATGNVTGEDNIGGFVGENEGTITECQATGNVTGNEYVGGFAGDNSSFATITDCTATGEATGNEYVGGFVGENSNNGTITNCTATGNVTGNTDVGGFVGWNIDKGKITGCQATGNVNGLVSVGGFVGENQEGGIITTCTAEGEVTGNTDVGGFAGDNISFSLIATITNCTARGKVKGKETVGGFVGFKRGIITNCHSTGNVGVTRNNPFDDTIGNGKTLDKKKVVKGTITGILLAGTVGGVAFGTIGFDKAGSALRNAWNGVKTFFNEKVMSNSNYKKVIGALIAFGIAAIIIIVPIEEFRKKNHIDIPIGGFVGYNGGKIENCTSSGKVTVEKVSMCVSVGGFAGYNEVTGTITNCEAEEYVHANTKLSGKAGGFVGDNNGMIYESKFNGERVYLSTGILYKDDCCGGFAGKNSAGGVIDWCEVGEVKAEPVGYGKKVGKGITTVETTNKTKGGGLVGVAGKLSNTTNCTYKTRRKVNIGEVGVKVCYKIETGAIVINCYSK